MQCNMPVRRFPSSSDSAELEYCELFRRYKIRECYVMLCPLNDLKDNISIDRKKEIDQELISRFNVQQCFVVIKNPPFDFIEQMLRNERALKNISIVKDVGNADNISGLPETRKITISKQAGMEMKGKRPGNLDYPEYEFPEMFAESPRKKVVKVFSVVGPTLKILKNQPGKMEKEQYLFQRRIEEIALKIRSKPPPVNSLLYRGKKRKDLALKVKRKALVHKINMSLALKIKRKALALKIKSKIPPKTKMRGKRPDNLNCLKRVKKRKYSSETPTQRKSRL